MNDTSRPDGGPAADLEAILTRQGGGGRLRRWRVPLIAGLILLLLAAYFMFGGNGDAGKPQYRTEAVERGTLVVTVSATGRLEPTNQVEVGSEMSGTVESVFVDDDDRVTEGQILAELDLSKFEDAVARSRAAAAAAEAALEQAEATVTEVRARLTRFREVSRLSGGKVPSHAEMETAEAELARAEANVASAQAGVAQARAALRSDETDLYKARIRSPIDGVVLERAVDPGQTVAASLQAVTLFLLAEDLTQMELRVDVDEADVGQVQPGQPASFSVDAWPGRRFEAEIIRVGYNATDSDGVISYPAVLKVDNRDLSLRPGMTGTAEITTLVREDALLVPNAALRFTPPAAPAAEDSGRGVIGSLMPRRPAQSNSRSRAAGSGEGGQALWVLRDGEAVRLPVETGATNGRVTEVLGGGLEPGMQVITEMSLAR